MASFSISTSLSPSHSLSKRSPLSPAYSRPWVPSHPRLNSSTWRFRPPKLNARLENKPGDPPSSTPREAQSLSDKQLQDQLTVSWTHGCSPQCQKEILPLNSECDTSAQIWSTLEVLDSANPSANLVMGSMQDAPQGKKKYYNLGNNENYGQGYG
ncbi:hypothetical protein CK203_076778 [Vitis vinifera]|uniref:Uncharacterized protein n=1 Tax=Vitis vinifera TaxID=29760 RepID=A0A438EPC6_VITVI|nr:hypothetical protein CK203_076778 [Vitis vinifera]